MAVRAEQGSQPRLSATLEHPFVQSALSTLLSMAAIVSFLVAMVGAAVLGYGLFYRDQVYPGVQAVGVELGGVPTDRAKAELDERTQRYVANTELTFIHDGGEYPVSLDALGVEFDNARTIENAYDVGRSGNWWVDSWSWIESFVVGREVGVHAEVDDAQVEAYLQSIASDLTVSAEEPRFVLTDSGELQLTAASDGRGIDVNATKQNLQAELSQLGNGDVQIAFTSVPPAYDETALRPTFDRMAGILSSPLVLEQSGFTWQLTVEQVRSLVSVEVDEQTRNADLTLDVDRLEGYIRQIAQDSYREGRNASVRWDGEQFEVVPASDGWEIDVDASVVKAEKAILNGDHEVELTSEARPARITTADAEAAAQYGNDLAASRFLLTWDGGQTDIGGSVIAASMSFVETDSGDDLAPTFNLDDLALFLTSIENQVEIEPVNANLRYINGEVQVLSTEEPGLEIDRESSAENIAEAVKNGEQRAELVVNEAEPEITAAMAGEIQIREMLASGETYYSGSTDNRRHNVELATERANGALVPPGGTYSFVESIGGDISVDSGYRTGFGIVATSDGSVSTVPSVGGGVCQISTTMFHAAFWAGMPIEERSWHMYWIPTYGQPPSGITGLDATVDTGAGLDFKFKNTTDNWLAVVASADGNAVRFELWGTDPGWNIEVGDPRITNRVPGNTEMIYEETDQLPAGTSTFVESAQDGFDVEINRRVFDSNGELIDELDLFSSYRPASNRTLVGTGG